MATPAGDIAVRVGADTTGLTKGLKDADAKLAEFGSKVGDIAGKVAALGVAAAAAGTAIAAAMVRAGAESARELDRMAMVANAGVVEFQKMAAGAKTVGIENDKLADILKDVNDRVGDFIQTGGGPMADFFEKIAPKVGVTAEQFRKLSGPEALQLYVDSLQKAGLSQAEMTFYMEAMASDATALIPLLKDGGAAMNAQADAAQRLGLILSDIEVEQLKQTGVAMEQVGQMMEAISNRVAVELGPVVEAVARQFREAAEEGGGFGEIVSAAISAAIKSVAFLANAIDGVTRIGDAVANGLVYAFALIQETFNKVALGIVETLDMIPGVDLTANITALEAKVKQAQGVMREAAGEIRANFEKPLAGDVFMQYAEQAKQASREAAEATVAARNSVQAGGGAGGVDTTAQEQAASELAQKQAAWDAELDAFIVAEGEKAAAKDAADKARFASDIARIEEQYKTEAELLAEKLAQEQAIIAAAREAGAISQEQYDAMMLNAMVANEAEKSAIEQAATQQRLRQAEQEAAAKRAILGQAFGGLTSLMNSESRKMFEIGKAASISQAVVSTYTGMAKALELGWPLGPVAAAAIALNGFNQVANIRKQTFGGGGAGATATGSNTAAINAGNTGVSTGGNAGPTQRTNVTLVGDTFSRESVIGLLNQAFKDGFTLSEA